MKKLFAVLFGLLLFANVANATTYYVTSTACNAMASDTNNGTSISTPWASTAKVNSSTYSTDIVEFQSGCSLTGKLTTSASLTTYGGTAQAQIVGSGSDYAYDNNSQNFFLSNIDFENTGYSAARIGAFYQNITSGTITGAKFGITGGTSSNYPLYFQASGYSIGNVSVTNTEITDPSAGNTVEIYHSAAKVYNFTFSNDNIHDSANAGITIISPSESDTTSGSYYPYGFQINYNNFSNLKTQGAVNFTTGMFGTPSPCSVSNNIVTNIGSSASPNVNAFQLEYMNGCTVNGNNINGIVTSAPDGDGIEIDWAWADITKLSNNNTVCYNTITGATSGVTSSGIRMYAGTNNNVCYNLTYGNTTGISNPNSFTSGNVYDHNTMVYNQNGGGVDGLSGSGVASTWTNNIFGFNVNFGFKVSNNFTPPTESNNDWYGNGTANIYNYSTSTPIAINSSDLTLNPLFVNAASNNYTLTAFSPMIGAGTRTTGNYQYIGNRDITGFSNNGALTDLGAFTWRP